MSQKAAPEIVDQRLREWAHLPRRASWKYLEGWPSYIGRRDLEQIAYITLMELARKLPADQEDSFGALATTAIKRDLIDYRRHLLGKEGKKGATALAVPLPDSFNELAGPESPAFEHVDAIRGAFRQLKLTAQEQRVIGYLLQDLSVREIANRMSVTPTTIYHVINAVRDRLQPLRSQM